MGGSRGLQIGCAAGSWAVGDAGGTVGLQPELLAGSRCAVSDCTQHLRGRLVRKMSQRQAQVRWWAQPRKGRSSPKVSGTHLDLVNQAHVRLWNPLRVPASRLRATDSGRTWHGAAQLGRGWWWKRQCRGRARGFQGGWWSPAVTPTDRNPAETFAPALSTPHATPSTPPHAACWSTPATPAAGRASGAEGSRS